MFFDGLKVLQEALYTIKFFNVFRMSDNKYA